MTELRQTDTNAADDAKGRAFGLEGNLYVPLLLALVASLGAFTLIGPVGGLPYPAAGGIAALPLLFVFLWVFGLRHGRPTGYDRDWVDQFLGRGDFTRKSQEQEDYA